MPPVCVIKSTSVACVDHPPRASQSKHGVPLWPVHCAKTCARYSATPAPAPSLRPLPPASHAQHSTQSSFYFTKSTPVACVEPCKGFAEQVPVPLWPALRDHPFYSKSSSNILKHNTLSDRHQMVPHGGMCAGAASCPAQGYAVPFRLRGVMRLQLVPLCQFVISFQSQLHGIRTGLLVRRNVPRHPASECVFRRISATALCE